MASLSEPPQARDERGDARYVVAVVVLAIIVGVLLALGATQ